MLEKVYTVQWISGGSERTFKRGIGSETLESGIGVFATRELAEAWVAKDADGATVEWAYFNDGTVGVGRYTRKLFSDVFTQYMLVAELRIHYDTNVI